MTQARRESRVVCRKGRESRKLSVRFARTLFPLLNAILTFSNYSHTVSRVSPFSILSIFRTISLHEREESEGSWRNENSWNLFGLTRSVGSRDWKLDREASRRKRGEKRWKNKGISVRRETVMKSVRFLPPRARGKLCHFLSACFHAGTIHAPRYKPNNTALNVNVIVDTVTRSLSTTPWSFLIDRRYDPSY